MTTPTPPTPDFAELRRLLSEITTDELTVKAGYDSGRMVCQMRHPELCVSVETVADGLEPWKHYAANARFFAAAPKAVKALLDALATAERERDAYRKAKAENDERFMIERDEARNDRDALRAEVARLRAEVHQLTQFVPDEP